MKKLLFTSLVIGTALMAKGQQVALQSAPEGIPSIRWEKTTIDLGKVKQNHPATVEFVFSNSGNGALVITEVKPSCSCTIPNYSKEPIPAGKKGNVKAEYNAKNLGSFHKTVTVFSNAGGGAETLTFQGEVVE